MLKIKLSRIGKKKHPIYRLIVSEVGRDPFGKILENLGSWDPHTKDLQVKADRVKHWIDHGAQMTDTINNLFVEKKIIKGRKVNVSALGKKAKDALKKSQAVSAESSGEPKAAAAPIDIGATDEPQEAAASTVAKAMVDEKLAEAEEVPVESAPVAEAPVEATPEAPSSAEATEGKPENEVIAAEPVAEQEATDEPKVASAESSGEPKEEAHQ